MKHDQEKQNPLQTVAALTPPACSALPIPKALYPCKYCYEEYSWDPGDLHWSAKAEGWVCSNCWEEEDHGDHGIRLDQEIARQNLECSHGPNQKQ